MSTIEIIAFLEGVIEKGLVGLKKKVKLFSQDLQTVRKMEKGSPMFFYIIIKSFWTDHDGKHTFFQNRKPLVLEEAIKRAIRKARRTNGNEKISLENGFSVAAILPKGTQIFLPKELWIGKVRRILKEFDK